MPQSTSRMALLSVVLSAACEPIELGWSQRANAVGGASAHATGGSTQGVAGESSRGGVFPVAGESSATGGVRSMIDGGEAGLRPASGGVTEVPVAGADSGGSTPGEAGAGEAGGAGRSSASGGRQGTTCSGARITIEGTLRSPRGEPLAGVEVTLSRDADDVSISDDDGHYRFPALCSDGYYVVTPTSPDWAFCPAKAENWLADRNLQEDFTGSLEGCDSSPIVRQLSLLIYEPQLPSVTGERRVSELLNAENPTQLALRLMRAIESVSNGHARYEIAQIQVVNEFPLQSDGYSYTAESYAACLRDPSLCHPVEQADYEAIAQRHAVCAGLDDHSVDEVWLLGGPHFGFGAWQPLALGCNLEADVLGFSYTSELTALLATYQERSVGALARAYDTYVPDASPNAFEAFTRVPPVTVGSTGCGNDRQAPNSLELGRFDDPVEASSYCLSYLDVAAPTGPGSTQLGCTAWGCTELGYRRFWFSHLPRASGLDGHGKHADFWRYILQPEGRALPITVSCSTSYAEGWCALLADHVRGECNANEWATNGLATGWVDVALGGKRTVREIWLYDRACKEQVLSGHIEFSDGSSDLTFGALENDGRLPTVVSFPAKRLTSFRVVIEESTRSEIEGLVNPGLSEIAVY